MIIINWITFGVVTELHKSSALEDVQKLSLLIKKIDREGLQPFEITS